MASASEVVVKFIVEAQRANKGIDDLIARVNLLSASLAKGVGSDAANDLNNLARNYKAAFDKAQQGARKAVDAIAALEKAQKRLQSQSARGPGGQFISRRIQPDRRRTGEAEAFAEFVPKGAKPGAGAVQIQQGLEAATAAALRYKGEIEALQSEILELGNLAEQTVQKNLSAQEQEAQQAERRNQQKRQEIELEQQNNALYAKRTVEQALDNRAVAIERNIAKLQEQKALLLDQAKASLPPQQQRQLEQGLKQVGTAASEREKIASIDERILKIRQEIIAVRGKEAAKVFGTNELETAKQLLPILEQIRQAGGAGKDTTAQEQKLIGLIRQKEQAQIAATTAARRADRALAAQEGQVALQGQKDSLREIESRLGTLRQQYLETFRRDQLTGGLAPLSNLLAEEVKLRNQVAQITERGVVADEKREKLLQRIAALQVQIKQQVQQGGEGLVGPLDEKSLKPKGGGLDRLLVSVLGDFKRRFVATLQFAISGALIFGVQRFIREFIQAAIEVERTFTDISTAFEFDVDAGRGTADFRRQVEGIRQETLLLAAEFNTLPTEVNESAFKMVARFNDVENAMKALRAQLLATKVSTIDQSEVLRSLTAVAEGWASQILVTNQALSLQERLLKKEAVAADLYGTALDQAVAIQQQFGIDVEDILEGTARATQVFRQMGFTMEETEAIVGSVSRELGQTGVQAAERLNRSLGQLTNPKIRDSLLDLAESSEAFNLGISDFSSGAEAWKKISRQFQTLERTAPSVAREILNIIGQRRELEAVAAALGTSDLQQQIVGAAKFAAGAAERRFSFLDQTVSELLKSLATGFQELAQNFERLGGLTTIKFLLLGANELLAAINTLLKLVIDLGTAIESLPGFGWFTGVAKAVTQVGASIFIATNLIGAFKRAIVELNAIKGTTAFANIAGIFGGGGGVGLGVRASRLGTAGAFRGGALGAGQKGLAVLGGAAAKTGAALSSMAGPIGLVVLAIGGMALGFAALKEKTDRLAKSYSDGINEIRKAGIDARRISIEEGESAREAELRRVQAEFETFTDILSSAESGQPGWQEALGTAARELSIIPKIWSSIRGTPGDAAPGVASFQLGRAQFSPEDIEGTAQFWEPRVAAKARDFIALQVEDFIKSITDIDLTKFEGQRFQGDFGIRWGERGLGRGRGFGATDISESLIEEANQIVEELDAALDEGDFDRVSQIIQESFTDLEGLGTAKTVLLETLGILPKAIERAVNNLLKELNSLTSKQALGDLSAEQANARRKEIAQELRDSADELEQAGGPEDKQAAEETRNRAIEAEVSYQQGLIENLENTLAAENFRLGELEQNLAKLEALEQLIASGELKGETLAQALLEADQINHQISVDQLKAALEEKKRAIGLAQSYDERIRATRAYIKALEITAAIFDQMGWSQFASQLLQEAEDLQNSMNKDIQDQLTREAVAQIRLDGPINNERNKLLSDLAKATADANDAMLGPGEQAEALIRQQEIQAQIAQLNVREVTAQASTALKTRDALGEQALALGKLNAEQKVIARYMGRNTAEWFEAERAIQLANEELEDLALELEGINRLLGGDITDPLAEASNEYIQMARSLEQQGPDLGELEKGRAELDARRAEVGLTQARFDSALFDLSFLAETGELGTGAYVSALETLLSQVDTSTRQGKEIFLQIQGVIDGLTEDVSDLQFNIPGAIRLPTLFEIRRAVEADAMGVNYLDNKQIDVRVNVQTVADLGELLTELQGVMPAQVVVDAGRTTSGNAGLTSGGLF